MPQGEQHCPMVEKWTDYRGFVQEEQPSLPTDPKKSMRRLEAAGAVERTSWDHGRVETGSCADGAI